MLVFKRIDFGLAVGLLVTYVLFVIIVIIQSSMKVDDILEDKDEKEILMKAAEFNQMIEFKRQATRSIANGETSVNQNMLTEERSKKLTVTSVYQKKYSTRFLDDGDKLGTEFKK